MFTGLVEELGTVVAVQRGAASARLTLDAPHTAGKTAIGGSVAINGACLTAVEKQGSRLTFEAVPETLRRTTLGGLRAGDRVNLETALTPSQPLGGHFVQGHVDGTGVLQSVAREDTARVLQVGVGPELARYIVAKGSVAVEGISLTVVDAAPDHFTVSVIPHTWEHTTLRERRAGDLLNIETDLLARYVERLLDARLGGASLTASQLARAGFMDE